MKPTQKIKSTYTAIKSLFLLAALFSSIMISAQTNFVSLSIARDITGSGLGGNICPALVFTHKNSTLSVGPNFQRQKMNFSGFQANYRYSVAENYSQKLELFFSGNFTVHTSAFMSKSYVEIEENSHTEETFHGGELHLKVLEGYAGIGLKVNPTKSFSVAFSSGIGCFDTLNKDYCREMYRQKSGVVLQVRLALIYNFKTFMD